jgi:hypothetical protein
LRFGLFGLCFCLFPPIMNFTIRPRHYDVISGFVFIFCSYAGWALCVCKAKFLLMTFSYKLLKTSQVLVAFGEWYQFQLTKTDCLLFIFCFPHCSIKDEFESHLYKRKCFIWLNEEKSITKWKHWFWYIIGKREANRNVPARHLEIRFATILGNLSFW